MKLTASAIKKLEARGGKRTEYFDESLPGFAVRVSPSGRKSFSVLYRSGRRLRRYTLGPYPVLGLAKARELARTALAQAALGGDPALKKVERRPAFAKASAGEPGPFPSLFPEARPNRPLPSTQKSVERFRRRVSHGVDRHPASRHRQNPEPHRAPRHGYLRSLLL